VLIRLARSVGRACVFAVRVVVVGLGMGVLPPSLVVRMLRHEDPTVQIADEENPP
jgi:hypothetical protein